MSVDLFTYDFGVPPSEGSIFLAGPSISLPGSPFTPWRVEFVEALADAGWAGTVVIPEFAEKGDFQAQRTTRWGRTVVPPGVPSKPEAWGCLRWEEEAMAAVQLVVAWADFRDVQPGAGINGRPELQGIMENAALRRKLVLGISDACTGATRFWSLWDRHREIPLARDLKGLINLTVARSLNPPCRV